jgi:hypothetical protein
MSAAVSLARAFSMQTVAEGAEDDAGFVIACPSPAAEAFNQEKGERPANSDVRLIADSAGEPISPARRSFL